MDTSTYLEIANLWNQSSTSSYNHSIDQAFDMNGMDICDQIFDYVIEIRSESSRYQQLVSTTIAAPRELSMYKFSCRFPSDIQRALYNFASEKCLKLAPKLVSVLFKFQSVEISCFA